MLAEEIAKALDVPLIQWHIKSTTKAQQGLYEYDAVSRLRDSASLATSACTTSRNYIVKGKLWEAFEADAPAVLLIDEIDKADIEFPNDLLLELDRMEFYVYETRQLDQGAAPPDRDHHVATTRRSCPTPSCAAASSTTSASPIRRPWQRIVDVHYPGLKSDLLREALTLFFEVRETPGLKKKPSTSELLDWIKLLMAEDMPPEALRTRRPQEADPAAARRAAEERAGRAPVRAAGVPAAAAAARRGLSVMPRARACSSTSSTSCARRACRSSLTEYLALLEALRGSGSPTTASRISTTCRATCLVKDERNFDRFDQVFAAASSRGSRRADGAEPSPPKSREEWLRKLAEKYLTRGGEAADPVAGRLGEADGDAGAAAGGAAGPPPGRQQVDRHGRHLAVRRLWLQSRRRAHRPGREPPPPRGQGLGQARVQQPRRHGRARHPQHQGRAAPAAPVRARGAAEELDLDGTIRCTARNAGLLDLQDGPGAAQRGQGAAVPRCRRLDGRPRPHLRGAVLRRARGVQAPGVFLLPQLRLRRRLEDNRRRHAERMSTWDVLHTYGPTTSWSSSATPR